MPSPPAPLPPSAPVVLDAQAHPGEQVVALVERRRAADQGVAQSFLDDAHRTISPIAEPRGLRWRLHRASPRCRWVFTELREMPSVSAMSSMPSSS